MKELTKILKNIIYIQELPSLKFTPRNFKCFFCIELILAGVRDIPNRKNSLKTGTVSRNNLDIQGPISSWECELRTERILDSRAELGWEVLGALHEVLSLKLTIYGREKHLRILSTEVT